MKLRLQSNSIRLRLKRGEVEQLAKTGRVEETIIMARGRRRLSVCPGSVARGFHSAGCFEQEGDLVRVPVETVSRWAAGDDVGMEAILRWGGRDGFRCW